MTTTDLGDKPNNFDCTLIIKPSNTQLEPPAGFHTCQTYMYHNIYENPDVLSTTKMTNPDVLSTLLCIYYNKYIYGGSYTTVNYNISNFF